MDFEVTESAGGAVPTPERTPMLHHDMPPWPPRPENEQPPIGETPFLCIHGRGWCLRIDTLPRVPRRMRMGLAVLACAAVLGYLGPAPR